MNETATRCLGSSCIIVRILELFFFFNCINKLLIFLNSFKNGHIDSNYKNKTTTPHKKNLIICHLVSFSLHMQLLCTAGLVDMMETIMAAKISFVLFYKHKPCCGGGSALLHMYVCMYVSARPAPRSYFFKIYFCAPRKTALSHLESFMFPQTESKL